MHIVTAQFKDMIGGAIVELSPTNCEANIHGHIVPEENGVFWVLLISSFPLQS